MHPARTALLAAALVLAVAYALPAHAHRSQLKSNLLRLDGSYPNGFLQIRPTSGGKISLDLPHHPVDGALVIDFRLNGVPLPSMTYELRADRQTWPLGFETGDQDKVEIHDLSVQDHLGKVVATLGAANNPRAAYVLAAPLVWVVDTASDVGFTRGGDTLLKKNGEFSVGFDALRSRATGGRLNNSGNYAEIELSVNDGPWQVFTVTFDVRSGKSRPGGRPRVNVGTTPADRVRVRRVDVFDSSGNEFATLGVRMGKQGHYLEMPPSAMPPPTATPTPTASPTPEPTATPAPSATPEPPPSATPEPTPEPPPSATPAEATP